MRIKQIGTLAVKLLFPPRCNWCDAVLGFVPSCTECEERIKNLAWPRGVPAERTDRVLTFVKQVFAPYQYQSLVKDSVLRMKFSDRPEMASFFAGKMAWYLQDAQIPKPDWIIPVPSSKNENKNRGYDVPQQLAQGIAKQLAIPVCEDCLYKAFDTARQMELSGKGRRANLLGAFSVRDAQKLEGKTVLLVDDILTTGSTLNECAKMLCAAGVKTCYAVCIACTVDKKEKLHE